MLDPSYWTPERCVALIEAVGLNYKDCKSIEEVNAKMSGTSEGGLVFCFAPGPFIFKSDDGQHVLVLPDMPEYQTWGQDEWRQIMEALRGKSDLESRYDLSW